LVGAFSSTDSSKEEQATTEKNAREQLKKREALVMGSDRGV
jgi:hypothetical protein